MNSWTIKDFGKQYENGKLISSVFIVENVQPGDYSKIDNLPEELEKYAIILSYHNSEEYFMEVGIPCIPLMDLSEFPMISVYMYFKDQSIYENNVRNSFLDDIDIAFNKQQYYINNNIRVSDRNKEFDAMFYLSANINKPSNLLKRIAYNF